MRRLLGPVLCYSTGVAMAPTWTDAARVARTLVPPLSHAAHKGQMGRIAVLGGSLEYTGAPYYAAAATLKVGADLAWVFTAALARFFLDGIFAYVISSCLIVLWQMVRQLPSS